MIAGIALAKRQSLRIVSFKKNLHIQVVSAAAFFYNNDESIVSINDGLGMWPQRRFMRCRTLLYEAPILFYGFGVSGSSSLPHPQALHEIISCTGHSASHRQCVLSTKDSRKGNNYVSNFELHRQ